MNKIFGILVMIALLAFSAVAVSATAVSTVRVHAVDTDGNNLTGVVVAPEWKGTFFGWNDFVPKEKTTGSDGMASASSWVIFPGKKIQVNYATLENYTCTRGAETQLVSQSGVNTLTTVCIPDADPEVPEFGVIAAGLALVGAMGMIFVSRKN
jgi:hypothetical protein